MMDFRFRACVAWALAALLLAAGCSQNRWFAAKSDDSGPSGSVDPTCGAGASAAKDSGGATDLKNPSAMARLCESHGQTAEAKRLYEDAIQRHPKDPAGYHGLALLYAKQGQFKEAEPYFTRALALAPDRADLLGDMGYFYYLCSRSQEAERYLRRAVELEPNQPTYGNNLALVLGEQGHDKESLDLFRRFGTEGQAYANMAFVYAQRGDYPKALETYNRVLTQDPKDHTAATAMLQVSKLQDQRQRTGQQLAGQSPQPPVVPIAAPPAPAIAAADKAIAPPDKAVVVADKATAAPDKAIVVADKATAAPDKAIVVADKATAVPDKPIAVADKAIVPATPSDLPPAAAACTQVSAEVDQETPPVNEVRWPEGALDVERFPTAAQ